MPKKTLKIKRVYSPYEPADGFRILVDRLWPRGVSKARAHIDLWFREVAPSKKLRQWFSHDPAKWEEFVKRYAAELKNEKDTVAEFRELLKGQGTVTLIYAAKDEKHNQAAALKRILKL